MGKWYILKYGNAANLAFALYFKKDSEMENMY